MSWPLRAKQTVLEGKHWPEHGCCSHILRGYKQKFSMQQRQMGKHEKHRRAVMVYSEDLVSAGKQDVNHITFLRKPKMLVSEEAQSARAATGGPQVYSCFTLCVLFIATVKHSASTTLRAALVLLHFVFHCFI